MARGVTFLSTESFGTAMSTLRRLVNFERKLAAPGTGKGAALVDVVDAGAYLTGTTVEAALQELALVRPDVTALTDPGNGGAIPVTRSGCVPIVTAGAETRTLARPTFINQRITLFFQTDGGDCVVTVAAAINVAGNTVITFDTVNESIQLVAAYTGAALAWRVAQNDGGTLT